MAVYRVIYEEFDGSSVVRRNARLVRYCTLTEMHDLVSGKYSSGGRNLIEIRPETAFELLFHQAARVTVRSLRVGVGLFVGLAAYTFIIAASPSIGDIPIGQLTFGEIFGALFRGALFVAFLALAWWIAFGAGPTYAD